MLWHRKGVHRYAAKGNFALILLFLLSISFKGISQCAISASATDTVLTCGESTQLNLEAHWNQIPLGNLKFLRGISFPNKDTGYICGDSGRVYKTINGGITFTPVIPPRYNRFADIHFLTSQKGFLLGDTGEIFRTSNGGQSWDQAAISYTINNSYTWSFRKLNNLCVADLFTLYACGGLYATGGQSFAVILKSTNWGQTWTQLNTGDMKPVNSVYFLDSLTGFAAAADSIYKTTNGGLSWVGIYGYQYFNFYSFAFLNRDTGFVAMSGGVYGILRTFNGGQSWSNVYTSTGNLSFQALKLDNDKGIYAMGTGGLLKSNDLGQNWKKLKINMAINGNTRLEAISFLEGTKGVTVGGEPNSITGGFGIILKNELVDSVLWWPSDGLSQTQIANTVASPIASTTYFVTAKVGSCIASTDITIQVDPLKVTLPNDQLVACGDSILLLPTVNVSNPNLLTYQWIPNTYLNNPQIKNPYAKIKTKTTYQLRVESLNGCKDSGTMRIDLNFNVKTAEDFTLKCGDQKELTLAEAIWNKQTISLTPNSLTGIKDIAFPHPDTAYLLEGRIIWRSVNKGLSWSICYSGPTTSTGRWVKKAHFRHARLGYVAAFNDGPMIGTILKTTDGETWQELSVGGNYQIPSLCFPTDQMGFAIGNPGKILRTVNGGNSWIATVTGISHALNDIAFANTVIGYAVGNSGTILKTSNSGASWTLLSTGITTQLNSVFFISADTGFVAGNGNLVWKTTDGGINWVSTPYYSISLSTHGVRDLYFVNSQTGYLVTQYSTVVPMFNGGALFETKNGGISWRRILADSSAELCAVYANSAGFGLAVGGTNQMLIKSVINEAQNYTWTPNIGLSNPNIKNPIAQPTQNTTYQVTGWVADCFSQDQISVLVSPFMKPAMQTKDIVCGDSLRLNYPNVHIDVTASNQGLASWEILDSIGTPVMQSKNDEKTIGNFYLNPGRYQFKCRIKVIPPPLYIKIIPVVGDSIHETIYSTYDTLLIRNFTIGSTQSYQYTWQPTPTLIGPNTPANYYTLTITAPNGCSGSDTLKVNPKPFRISIGEFGYGMQIYNLTCGKELVLDTLENTYTGPLKINYAWINPYCFIDTLSLIPRVSPSATGKLTMQANLTNGCVAKDSIGVIVEPLALVVNDTGVSCKTKFTPSIYTNYQGNNSLLYLWTPNLEMDSNQVAKPKFSLSSPRKYNLKINSWNGCEANDSFQLSLKGGSAPNICITSVNNSNKNIIIWNKADSQFVVKYFLYRETNIANQYNLMAEIPVGASFLVEDSLSNPLVQSNRYVLSKQDVCGFTSNQSTPHKTIHLTMNKGTGNSWNLIWNLHEGIFVNTYNIYRGTDSISLTKIGTVAGTNNSYTDLSAPGGNVYYQVEVISNNVCDPGKTYNSSKSNLMSNKYVGLTDIENKLAFILYPNPANREVNLVWGENESELSAKLINQQGITVLSKKLYGHRDTLSLEGIASGMYLIELQGQKYIERRRLLIE